MTKISVISCTYNRNYLLDTAIDILKKQTLKDIEFIVVDDGSTDGSFEKLESLTKGDERFVLIQQKTNKGPSAARNMALNVVSGQYVGFFDIDDAIDDNYFEKLYETAVRENVDIVYTLYNKERHLSKKVKIEKLSERLAALRNGAIWDKLFLTDKIKNIRFREGYMCADNMFLFDAINQTKSLYLMNEPRYSYTLQPDSIGVDKCRIEKRKQNILEIIGILKEKAEQKNYSYNEMHQLRNFLYRTFAGYEQDKIWLWKFYKAVGIWRVAFIKIGHFLIQKKVTKKGKLIIKVCKIPIFSKSIG